MGDGVRPRNEAPAKPGTPEYYVRAMAEEPWFTKHRHAVSLVQSLVVTQGIPRVHDEGDVAAVAGRIMQQYVRPNVRGSDVQLAGLYDDIASAVRFFKTPPPNSKPTKRKRGASSAPSVRPVEVADPVEHFRGEYIHESTDLVLHGAGIDFAFHRTYRHQTIYDGPLGHRWDHGYNLFLTVNEHRAFLWTGTGRQDLYARHARFGQSGFNYYVPPDGVDATLEPLGDPDAPAGWIRRAPDGMRHVFEPEPGWSGAYRLARIEDRWGNYLRFEHVDGRLDRCYVNHQERWVRFHYDEEGRITRVADFTDRAWRYVYDSHGDLIHVITPSTATRARGCVTEYRYSTAEHPGGPLAHNLTDVFDPEGRHYLRNRYGSNVGMEDYNRVVYQRLAHGDFWFRYGAVDADDRADLPLQDRPAFRCWVKERNGYQTLYIYNAVGNLLRKEETHKQSGAKSTRAVWRFRYNRDGQLVASRSPEGVVTHELTGRDHFYRVHTVDPNVPGAEDDLWRHEHLTAAERRGFARVLATVNRARHHAGTLFDWSDRWGDVYQADAEDIIVKQTFEPTYGQPLTTSDPRATTSADPRAIEPPEYDRLLTRHEYEGPAGDPTRDLARVIAPTPTLPDGTAGGPVVMEVLQRDERGRVTRSRDAAGTETRTDYFPDSTGSRAGFVHRYVVDPGDTADGHLNITTEFEVDELGRVRATIKPRGVGSGDGRFVMRFDHDELDRVTVERGPTPIAAEIRTRYGPAGKPERIETDWRDPDGSLHAVIVRRFKYNEEHQVVKETWGGTDLGSHFRIAHKYDAAGTLRFTMAANDTTLHFRYDSRDQLVQSIRSYGVQGEAIETIRRDRDGRIVAKRSGEGRTETYDLDALGRVIAVTDALGHVTRTSYDKAGHPIVQRHFERRADGSNWLLARSESAYDELGRLIRTVANRFDEPLLASDVTVDFEEAPGPGHRVESQTFYDGVGRVVRTVDPLGNATSTEYDAAGRTVRVTDAVGNRLETRYDAHGNPVRRDRLDLVRDTDSNIVGQEVLTWLGAYDERDRLITETDGLGNTTEYQYDSLDQRVLVRDPLGNRTAIEYDLYGRIVSTTEHRTESGLGDGTPLDPASIRFEHDRSGNLTAHVDALGRRTEYRLDRSNRVIELVFPDGARVVTRYDRDDLITAVRDAHGVVLRHEYDDAGRLIRTTVDDAEIDAGITLEGARLIECEYDGLDRQTLARNEAVTIATSFDSLGHPARERTIVHAAGGLELTLERGLDDAGRVSHLLYPGGRRVRHERDALGRVQQLVHESDGASYPGAPSGTPRVITRHAYAGTRARRIERTNGVATQFDHDAAGRRVDIHHHSEISGTILRTQQLRDAARNARLRLEAQATTTMPASAGARADRFAYDAQYQLTARAVAPDQAFVELGPFSPPSTPLSPLPKRQQLIDTAIGPLLPPAPSTGADILAYDIVGNRVQARSADGVTRMYEVNARDQYASVDATTRSYDRAGNLTGDGTLEYRFDAWRRLSHVVDAASGATIVRYIYDPSGRRVIEESPASIPLVLAHDGGDRIADFRGGACVAQYVHGDAVDDPLHLALGGSELWYHADHQGSIRALTDVTGHLAATYLLDPFGLVTEVLGLQLGAPGGTATNAQPFAFGGRPFDPLVALYDQRARSYEPGTGRFLQRDPAGAIDGSNLYVYAGNDPLSFVDPTGLARGEIDREAHEQYVEKIEATPVYQSEDRPWYSTAGKIATGVLKRATVYSPTGILFQLEYAKGFFETAAPLAEHAAKATGRRALFLPGAIAYDAYQTIQGLRQAPARTAKTASGLLDAITNPVDTLEALGPDGNFGRAFGKVGAVMAADKVLSGKGVQSVLGVLDAINDLRRVRLYHGTSRSGAVSILSKGVQPTSVNSAPFPPGSFFTHVGRNAKISADNWALSRGGPGRKGAILMGSLPRSVFKRLEKLKHLTVRHTGGWLGFARQAVFHPESFPVLNELVKWKEVRRVK